MWSAEKRAEGLEYNDQYGQAFAAQAALSPRMQRVSFWTNGAGAGQNGSAYPFTIEDFLPPAP